MLRLLDAGSAAISRRVTMKQFNHGSLSLSAALLLTPFAYGQPVGRDFNNDGTLDYPVSITEYNETTLPKGALRLWSGASKQAIHTILAESANTLFGYSVESAGDINADGFDDVIVGEPLAGVTDAWEGRVRIFSGDDGSMLLAVRGPLSEMGLGRYVTGIGDWNGDGTVDIAASGWVTLDMYGNGITTDGFGIVYVFSGADGTMLAEITDTSATEGFGFGIFPLGDINADGMSDIAITDPTAPGQAGTSASGAIYIYSGNSTIGSVFDFSNTSETILNGDTGIRTFGAQIDTMHPNRWTGSPTLQVLSLTTTDAEGGVTSAEFVADILELDGTFAGSKGTRPRLLDPGDIDMNGLVDANDVAQSAGQYGTSPNANGVMPVADLDKNGVVDEYDVATVLQSFGSTSNIFEDLWRDDRLRSIAGGSAGFGSRPGGSNIAPAGGFQPHPIDDDCTQIFAGPDSSLSILPYLLGLDTRINCAQCPACDATEPPDCYVCGSLGDLSGGETSVDIPQPIAGQTITFEVDDVSVKNIYTQCVPGCGGGENGRRCYSDDYDFAPAWEIDIWNTTNNDWDLGWRTSANGDSLSVTGTPCMELRLRRLEIEWNPPPNEPGYCETERLAEDVTRVEFANFELESKTQSPIPVQNRDRKTLGIGERVDVWVEGGHAASWELEPGSTGSIAPFQQGASLSNTNKIVFTAHHEAASSTVIATINGCRRKFTFKSILPTQLYFHDCPSTKYHTQGVEELGYWLKPLDLGPDTVSFLNCEVREGTCPPTDVYGAFASRPQENYYHDGDNIQVRDVRSDNIVVHVGTATPVGDHVWADNLQSHNGGWTWVIPLEIRVKGQTEWHKFDEVIQKFEMWSNCIRIDKEDSSETACEHHGTILFPPGNIQNVCPAAWPYHNN